MARFARALETAADAVLDFGPAEGVTTPGPAAAAAGAGAGVVAGAGAAASTAAVAPTFSAAAAGTLAEAQEGRAVVPGLKFDRLLGALLALGPAFAFQLPPYFLNNARALGALEGLAAQVYKKT